MSNPGVITLASKNIGQHLLKIEDNIGEAIHIHFGEFRLDLSIHEFVKLSNALTAIMEQMVNVKGFSFLDYDAIFLTQCCKRILDLKEICHDTALVGQLLTENEDKEVPFLTNIKNFYMVQAIHGNKEKLCRRSQENYYGDTNEERLQKVYESINANGYPYENHYIVTSDGGDYIIDGCHRASCIYALYGNVEIPIVCWKSKNQKYTDKEKIESLIEEKNRALWKKIKEKERREQIEKRKNLVYEILVRDLKDKRVIIKGAGVHTKEILKLVGNKINFVYILANSNGMEDINVSLPVKKSFDPEFQEADVILISSYKYRDEMKYELLEYRDKIEIYDIYAQGIDREFFS